MTYLWILISSRIFGVPWVQNSFVYLKANSANISTPQLHLLFNKAIYINQEKHFLLIYLLLLLLKMISVFLTMLTRSKNRHIPHFILTEFRTAVWRFAGTCHNSVITSCHLKFKMNSTLWVKQGYKFNYFWSSSLGLGFWIALNGNTV